ncbi:unnamed protein product [Arctia plantaginis]|uniref:Lipase domain-containing protein n=1 Tax=Arctia plantaginis TaxID=874455 RepID=A0A8S1A4Q6_ARCPL|nr:unnamed protein product [Arctia plantaginis]
MPDDEGILHLEDLHEPTQEDLVQARNGLDPAGPQWGGNSLALNRNDGQYVEVIHTNGGFYGIFDRIADADFYPNGGRNQPGCWSNVCSHGRAHELFAETVRRNHLNGRACSNINQVSNPNQCTGASLRMGNGIINKRGGNPLALNRNDGYVEATYGGFFGIFDRIANTPMEK